jgi:hypothetical protein
MLALPKENQLLLSPLFPDDDEDDDLSEEFPLGLFSPDLQNMVLSSPKSVFNIPHSHANLIDRHISFPTSFDGKISGLTKEALKYDPRKFDMIYSSACISPMIAPIRDPFSGPLGSIPPALVLNSEGKNRKTAKAEKNIDSSNASEPIQSSIPAINLPESKLIIKTPPLEYRSLRFSVTTYRWQPIEDCFGGVPIIEIRPYNKSDGKRYLYIKVEGIEEVYSRCRHSGIPFPKVRFMVESCSDSVCLGYLAMRENSEFKKDEEGNDANPNFRFQMMSEEVDEKNKIAVEDEGPLKEVIQLSRNLTLLASESIVRALDARNFGRGNPVEEHKLRIVVILLPNPDENLSAEEQISKGYEVASLPFYRIKRRAKKRRTKGQVEFEEEDDEPQAQWPLAGNKRFHAEVETAEADQKDPCFFDVSKPLPLINTAPNGPHFVDFYCITCGIEQSIKLINASDIICVSASANEIWARTSTKNCKLELDNHSHIEGASNQCDMSCRFCRSKIGNYFHNASALSGYLGQVFSQNESILRFRFVNPNTASPLLFYKFSQQVRIADAGRLYSEVSGEALSSESQLSLWMQERIQLGWIGRPLLSSEYPNHSGAYVGMSSVKSFDFLPDSVSSTSAESELLSLLHDMDCNTDAAWMCRALLPKHDRRASLCKVGLVLTKYGSVRDLLSGGVVCMFDRVYSVLLQ